MTSDALSQRVKQSWELRRAKYGPSGGNVGHSGGLGGLPHHLPGAHTHGHRNTYGRHGCRCVHCSDAHREYHRKLAGRRRAALANNPKSIRHGASGYANHHCRCTDCRVATYTREPIRYAALLATHCIAHVDGGFIMVSRARNIHAVSHAESMRGQILPDDFDDDTRITEAILRYHPPQAWTAC